MDEFEKCYNKALRFLGYRPRSEQEVKDNLLKKKASPLIIEKILDKLRQQKFVHDKEFAAWWIEQRTRVNKKSLRVIKIELQRKGIDKELIGSLIQDSEFVIQDDLGRAKELVGKRIDKYKGMTRQEIYQKLGSFLARRGFDWDTIKESIDEVLKEGV